MNRLEKAISRRPAAWAVSAYLILTVVPGAITPKNGWLVICFVRYIVPGVVAMLFARRFFRERGSLGVRGALASIGICAPTAVLIVVNIAFGQLPREICLGQIVTVLTGAAVEEILARGLLLRGLLASFEGRTYGRAEAIVLSSLIFGIAHLVNADDLGLWRTLFQCGYTAALGALYGFARVRSGSLWGPIFWHGALNVSGLM